MKEIKINKNNSGRKSATYLCKILPGASFGFINKMMRKKNITLNDSKMTGTEILQEGDVLKIYFSDDTLKKLSSDTRNINIDEYIKAYDNLKGIKVIYEDDDYLILDKPTGILSQKSSDKDVSINEWILGYLINKGEADKESLSECKPSVCNRLDRNTSGLILAGKTVAGLNSLNKIIKTRSIRKFYHAYVIGRVSTGDHLRSYLAKDEKNNISNIISIKEYNNLPASAQKKYSYIETDFELLEIIYDEQIKSNISKIEVELITGKSHQIRAQMSHIGHPLLGDAKYGYVSMNKILGEKYQLLRAVRVEFPLDDSLHALSGRIIEIE